MPDITFDHVRQELGRLAFENMVLRAELAEAKARSTLTPVPDEPCMSNAVAEITGRAGKPSPFRKDAG